MTAVSKPTKTACDDLLAAARELGLELDREAVLIAAARSAHLSSWSPADFLLTWAESIRETGTLPRALARLAGREEGA